MLGTTTTPWTQLFKTVWWRKADSGTTIQRFPFLNSFTVLIWMKLLTSQSTSNDHQEWSNSRTVGWCGVQQESDFCLQVRNLLDVEFIIRKSHLRKSYLVGLSKVGLPESISYHEILPHLLCTRSLGARWAPTSSWRPFGPAFCPSGILDFVLRALRALRPCDPRTDAGVGNIR